MQNNSYICLNTQLFMKKLILLLTGVALALSANAQVFNHLSLGVGTGLDGTSFELGVPLGGHVQIRAGYGTAFGLGYTFSGNNGISIPEHPDMENSPEVYVPLKLSFARNDARILFNIYPSKRAAFHFTFGTYLGVGSFFKGEMLNLPNDYNSVGLEMGDYIIKAKNNKIRAELRAFGLGSPGFAVQPYAGLGFGRPVRTDRRVTFSFDMGAAYQGTPSLWAFGRKSNGTEGYVDVSNNKEIDIKELVDEYGKYMNFLPIINFHLYVRIF